MVIGGGRTESGCLEPVDEIAGIIAFVVIERQHVQPVLQVLGLLLLMGLFVLGSPGLVLRLVFIDDLLHRKELVLRPVVGLGLVID